MCRFVAYAGSEVPLEDVVILPSHSLLRQSQHAHEAKLAVNGDGFGIAWYGADTRPGLYRDVLPAWSDGNLIDLCRMIRSPLFLAHVRASTVGETSRTNCHPFRWGRWSFMHNGQIGGFCHMRRALEADLPDDLFEARRGSTDSELLFLLMVAFGLDDNPLGAVRRAILELSALSRPDDQPTRITACFSDGTRLYGFRYSSDFRSPTLYVAPRFAKGRVMASEPLDPSVAWMPVEDRTFLEIGADGIRSAPMFETRQSASMASAMP